MGVLLPLPGAFRLCPDEVGGVSTTKAGTKPSEPVPETERIPLNGIDQLLLLGLNDRNLRAVEEAFPCRIQVRNGELRISGPPEGVRRAAQVFLHLIDLVQRGQEFDLNDVKRFCQEADGRVEALRELGGTKIYVPGHKRVIQPKTSGQEQYVKALEEEEIVVAIGPAGTGKTYLAVAMAVDALQKKRVRRVVLARPAVEAGEALGFLPGGIYEKVDPYLRPLYDAIGDMLPADWARQALETGVIEIAPLAYMRGRTLNDAFVILDEAQNATTKQMKMFLTRLGPNSKAVITGDTTQIDLEPRTESGLKQIERILKGIEGIAFIYLTERDVIRHRLVQQIIRAYERFEDTQISESETAEDP